MLPPTPLRRLCGANQDLLWQGFALCGFGQLANTNGTQDTDPTPDFSSPIGLGDVNPNGNLIERLGVSAQLNQGAPANNRFTALRSFDAYASRAGKVAANPTCDGSIDAGWTKIVSSLSDAFPSVNPRPVAPDLSLRYFDANPQAVATHIKVVVTNNQCTGQAS